jgi:thymidylate synthase ThyX
MAGMHLGFSGISQVAIKHLEDQRIGLAPIEKSTRYVNYSEKVNGQYRYYTDPTLDDMGLTEEYRAAMDGLFETYTRLIPRLSAWLSDRFPEEKASVVEKKAFDTLRGLLPTSTLSQVASSGMVRRLNT